MIENYCTLYLVRHGETEWNVAHRIMGHLDSPLTVEGIEAATALAQKLKHVQFNAVYSSDLLRAKRTAELLKLDRNLEVMTKEALRERTLGKYDGYVGSEYQEAVKELLEQYETLSERERWQFKFDERYESDEQLVSRFMTLLREVSAAHASQTVMVVTHGGCLRTFLTRLGYAPHGELKPGTFKNAGYIKVSCDGVEFFLDEVEGVDKAQGINTRTL